MPRKLGEIEAEALKLGTRARAALARRLMASLPLKGETAIERLWFDEAERRERELDAGRADTIPAREVLRRLRSGTARRRRSG